MREIKFRAMKHGQWHIFDFSDAQRWARELLQVMAKEDYELSFDTPFLQFTGLHDKNGKEIWEGDVIKFKETKYYDPEEFKERTMQVQFLGGAFSPAFYMDYALHDEDDKPMRIWDVEVLGNIYENPELLKGDSC